MQGSRMNRTEKYAALLHDLEKRANEEMYYDMIVSLVRKIDTVDI